VLGIDCDSVPIGNFTGTGMHGGQIFIRTDKELSNLPKQVTAEIATNEDMKQIYPYINEFANRFNKKTDELTQGTFFVLKPNARNPYKQLYTVN
jgi:glutamate synthase domain-containing protein 3